MSRDSLGEFEQVVLLAILRCSDGAYGITVVDEIRSRTGRSVLLPAAYVTLRRLEEKGFVSSRLGSPTAERGGRAKRFYTVEPEGVAKLRRSRKALISMWDGLGAVFDEG